MDYSLHYSRLITRAKNRNILGYTERHHIIPRCMGGTDDKSNLVRLTPEEHYVAHQLLIKMYPKNPNLVRAASMMCTNRSNNKLYGWIRRRHSTLQSASMKGTGNNMYNKRWISNEKETVLVDKSQADRLIESGEYIRGKKAVRAACGCLVTVRCKLHEKKREQATERKRSEFIKLTTKLFSEFIQSNANSVTEFAKMKNTSQPALTKVWKKYVPEYSKFVKQGKSFKNFIDTK